MRKVYGFASVDDINRISDAVRIIMTRYGINENGAGAPNQNATFVKCTDNTANGAAEGDDTYLKEGYGIEVEWNGDSYSWAEVTNDPIIYNNDEIESNDSIFARNNISSESALEIDEVYLVAYYPDLSETSDWVVIETGGGEGGSRSYVVITAVNSASSYVGDVVISPDDSDVLVEGVNIAVENATSNPFEEGYSAFADKSIDGSGDDIYYLSALLLS